MKKNYYLLFLFIGPIALVAQDYVPFNLQDGVTWQDYSFYGAGDPPGSDGGTTIAYSYQLIGDTLVDGHTYKKVYSRDDWYHDLERFSTGPDSYEEVLNEENYDNPYLLFGGLRQDTAAKTLYYVNWREDEEVYQGRCFGLVPAVGEEQLLYDFSLEEGDTAQTVFGPSVVNGTWTVTLEDGSERRAVDVDNQDGPWIEGIGGGGLGLFSPWVYPPFESGCGFYCYREEGEVLLRSVWGGIGGTPSNLNETCDALILSADDPIANSDFVVIPNPTRDFFTIVSPTSPSSIIGHVRLYNSLGQLVYENGNQNLNESIDASRWAMGVHYLIVETEGEMVLQTKILKVRD